MEKFRYIDVINNTDFERELESLCNDCLQEIKLTLRSSLLIRVPCKSVSGYIQQVITRRDSIRARANKHDQSKGTAFIDGFMMGIFIRCWTHSKDKL